MQRLRRLVRKLDLRWLAGLVGGYAFACSAPTSPGEAPPLAPRPVPVQPVPAEPRQAPVPGAPDPLAPPASPRTPDAGPVTEMPGPEVRGESYPQQQPPRDAGVDDAVALPPSLPDALPTDANKQPESNDLLCC